MGTSVDMIFPETLTWAQVDPKRYPFDPDTAPAVVRGLPPARSVPPPAPQFADSRYHIWSREQGQPWAGAMTVALVEHYGLWAIGWRWAVDEGDHDGGVVRAWCCAAHSIADPQVTLRRVADGLVEWHRWLVELDERFDRFLPIPDGAPPEAVAEVWERAVAQLVTVVVERTRAGSAWYRMCALVLRWFLSAAGVAPERHAELVDSAIDGRFESWTEPEPAVVSEVAGRLAAGAVDGQRA